MSGKFHCVDLKDHFCHKLVYRELPEKGGFGLDDICILRSNYFKGEKVVLNGAEFQLTSGGKDNIRCENQQINAGAYAEKVHILGFAYWGQNYDYARILFEDGSEEKFRLLLSDWAYELGAEHLSMQSEKYGCTVETAKVFPSSGRLLHFIYLYHFGYKLKKSGKIAKIVLPDNMFMHVFAVTLETGGAEE